MTQVKEKRVVRSGMSLLLTLVMLFSVVVAFPLDVSADVATERTLIKWHRVYTQADIKSGHMLLCWGGSATRDYVTIGGYESGWSMVGKPAMDYNNAINYGLKENLDEFYTFDDELVNWAGEEQKSWTIEFIGKYDGENNGIKKCHLRLPRNPGEGGGYIWNEYKWHMFTDNEYNLQQGSGNPSDSDFDWSISTNGDGSAYGRHTRYGYVQIFHEVGGRSDEELYGNGDKISCRGNSSYDYYDFILYIGEEVTATEYSSFTVRSGQTFALENFSILKEGCKITIEPGAVLRVSDTFINNGTIRNYGMYLIDENAVVSTYGTYREGAGSVYNYGNKDTVKDITGQTLKGEGNMIVLSNAVYALTKEYGYIKFNEGTSLHLNGMMTIGGYLEFYGGEFVINETGSLLVSYDFPQRLAGEGKNIGKLITNTNQDTYLYPVNKDGSPGRKFVMKYWAPIFGHNKNETTIGRLCLYDSQTYIRNEGRLAIYYVPDPLNDDWTFEEIAQKVENKSKSIFDTQGSGESYYVYQKR